MNNLSLLINFSHFVVVVVFQSTFVREITDLAPTTAVATQRPESANAVPDIPEKLATVKVCFTETLKI